MPLDRDRDTTIETVEDEDMPPLVDNPNPSLTYTFFPEITPLSFASTPAHIATQDFRPHPSKPLLSSPPPSPLTPDDSVAASSSPMIHTRTHGKRRGPSYIPRPPNAFILFRSAFIRDQNIPNQVEGNHSTLSKIVGLCWRRLSPEERKTWEDKALLAQEEHRARYPDWRFRPGTNALATMGTVEGPSTARRRSARRKKQSPETDQEETDQQDTVDTGGKTKEKGKAKLKASRLVDEETRCATIASFVAEGIKGEDLEAAVKQWEGDRKPVRPSRSSRSRSIRGVESSDSAPTHSRSHSSMVVLTLPPSSNHQQNLSNFSATSPPSSSTLNPKTLTLDVAKPSAGDSNPSPIGTNNSVSLLPDVPLTHLFKRSLSAPAPDNRPAYPTSSSDMSDESSNGDLSPISDFSKTHGVWGTETVRPPVTANRSSPVYDESLRRGTIPYQMPSSSSASRTFDQSSLTWQDAGRNPIERVQQSDGWWSSTGASSMPRPDFHFTEQREQSGDRLTATRMGYEGSNQFERTYLENYSYEAPRDLGTNMQWINLSSQNNHRQGLSLVVEDPYKDECSPLSPTPVDTLSLPPLSGNDFYYSQSASVNPPASGTPFSSYSTLSHWAGSEAKYQTPNSRTWPSNAIGNPSNSATWYNHDGSTSWGTMHPELQQHGLSATSQDWDRLEYRAGRELDLNVGPQQPEPTFQSEQQRLRENAA